MKKTITTLLCLALLGAGCVANKNTPLVPTSTTDTANSTSSTPPTKNFDSIKPDRFVLHDNLGAIPAHLRTNPIIEISEPKNITFSPADKDNSEGTVRYYRAGDVYFVITQQAGPMSMAGEIGNISVPGIWYAASWTDNIWKRYITLENSHVIANNFFQIWKEGRTTNVLTIDYAGTGNAEGTGKILTSEDGGVNWFVSSCFYVTPDTLADIFRGDHFKNLTFSRYLKQKIANHQIQNYIYNAKTGNYEFSQRNKTTGAAETIIQESCKNIAVPSKALTTETFSPSMIADNPKQIDVPVLINETEPVYTISVISATTTNQPT
jgi:hypothetical protein